jgi:O-antigen/teichoic acid export membrane protein
VKPLGAGVPLPPELLQRVRRHMRIVAVTVTVSFISAREVEVLFLSLYDSSAAAGQFKAAYQLASGAALLVPGVFGAVLLPMMANAISQGAKLAAWRFSTSTAYLVTLAAPLVVFGALFSHAVIALLYGRMYADAAPVLAVLMFACCFGALSSGASSLLVSADRQQHMLILTLVFGVLKVALDWLLIAHYGLMGAMAASAILAVSGSTATLLLALHVSGAGLPWSRLGRTLLAAVLAGLAAWPLRHLLPPLPTLLLGGLAIGLVYALATLLLRCWSRGDLEYMQSVIARMGRIAPAWLGRLLGWAAVRAGEEAT